MSFFHTIYLSYRPRSRVSLKLKVAMADDEEQVFEGLDIGNESAWDDTALIRAFERATQTHTLANDQDESCVERDLDEHRQLDKRHCPRKRKQSEISFGEHTPAIRNTQSGNNNTKKPQNLKHHKNHLRIGMSPPPPPPALYGMQIPEDIEQLLLSWYEAGYRAGMYAGKISSQRNDAVNENKYTKVHRDNEEEYKGENCSDGLSNERS